MICMCVSLWAWLEVVTAHHRVHDHACCHLQADCLESGISSGPLRLTMSMGTFTFTRLLAYLYIAHTEVVISVYAAMISKCVLIFFWNYLLQNVPCLCLDNSKPCLIFFVFFKLRLPLKFSKVFIVLWYFCIICVCRIYSVCL